MQQLDIVRVNVALKGEQLAWVSVWVPLCLPRAAFCHFSISQLPPGHVGVRTPHTVDLLWD